jgi:hypothetical protein
LEEVSLLKDILYEKYGIKTTLTQHKKKEGIGYRIYIPEGSANAFINLISPYVLDSFKYKISPTPPRGGVGPGNVFNN